jgi:hypothetical protein
MAKRVCVNKRVKLTSRTLDNIEQNIGGKS